MKTFPIRHAWKFVALLILCICLLKSEWSFAQSNTSAGATPLTSGTTCSPITGTTFNATYDALEGVTTCTGGTDRFDVWYTFTANSTNPIFNLTALGANFTTPRIQILSGTPGSFSTISCGTATPNFYSSGLTVGTIYYIRLYSTTTPIPTSAPNGSFTMCIVDPVNNDLCSNATVISSAVSCGLTNGTLMYATQSNPAVTTTCGSPAGSDVWYKFAAKSAYPTIYLRNQGASMLGTNARIQIFTGSCGSLTSLGCVSNSTLSTITTYPTGLTIGDSIYVRVYSNATAPATTAYNFDICIQDPPVNDVCSGAVILNSDIACNSIPGTVLNAIADASITTSCGTAGGDVWYKFAAKSVFPKILLSNGGASISGANARIQLFSGNCGTLNSLACVTGSTFSTATSYPTGLTIGDTFYVRIYSNTLVPTSSGTWNYDICVQDAPVNDVCAGAVVLTSNTSCSGVVSGTLYNAAISSPAIATTCGTAGADVWYKFAAQTTHPIISLSNFTGTLTGPNARIQLFSGPCGGLTPLACTTGATFTTATSYPAGLTVGDTFYIRVYSNTAAPVVNPYGFDICVRDPLPPLNDNCSGATALTPGSTCVNTAGTLFYATATASVPNECGNSSSQDVWYSFAASAPYPIITISSVGAQFAAAGPRLQLLSGTCGAWTSLACVNGTSINTGSTPGGAGLIVGNTYYIRVYSNTANISGATLGFNICITNPLPATVDYGRSYVNITKGSSGGTIEPGDVLEMRATFAVRSNSAFNVAFVDNIPTNTSYIPNTLRILTNEGKIYKQWTDAADGDPATLTGTTVNINLGNGATQTSGGAIKSTDRPLAGGACMTMVSYRVIVDAVSLGSLVDVGGGTIYYSNSDGTVNTVSFPLITARVYKNTGICANPTGTNTVAGTFGSGTAKDAGASPNVPSNYAYIPFSTSAPGDYYYGVSNNTSPSTAPANYSILMGDTISAHKVFGHWDVLGDHTNATDPLMGNPPTDVNSGASGGYMVVINASYRTDTAFLYTVNNLCPNTSYEYSAWFRNVCRTCGTDSTGAGFKSAGYIPNSPGDSSGVHPNLSFNINGYDYYTTGDILYTGQWIKKGFTYRTGPSETSMVISIRNNAPGGGGNDWAIDDIGVATCAPYLDVNPTDPTLNICYGNVGTLSAVVRSYFPDYNYYVWERSTDHGVSFTNTAFSSSGTITPTYNGSEYEYTAPGPTVVSDSFVHGNIYRLRVASSASNIIDPNCSFLATRTVQIYASNCAWLLKTDLLGASGSLQNNFSTIRWQTVNETRNVNFEIEKSSDGSHFTSIGKLAGNANGNGEGVYNFTDPTALKAPAYYRIKMLEGGNVKYSKIILLSPDKLFFDVKNLVNPFTSTLSFDVITPADGEVKVTVLDNYGRIVKMYNERVFKGLSPMRIQNLDRLSSGTYALKVEWQNESIVKRILKFNN